MSFDPSGFWNSAITLDLSPVDLSASVGSGRILGSSGVYIRFKPAPFLLVGVVVTVLTLTPIPDEFSLPVLARGLLEFVRP
ncbi:MAG TPA: hypothetical protein VJK02_25595 [Anaerolineales bacterium]|nr:hypothetical protein [Anaerolineales bacterium]